MIAFLFRALVSHHRAESKKCIQKLWRARGRSDVLTNSLIVEFFFKSPLSEFGVFSNDSEIREYVLVVVVNLVMDKIANRPRGFAFLRYTTEEESKKAIEGMHGKVSITCLLSSNSHFMRGMRGHSFMNPADFGKRKIWMQKKP